MGGFVLYQAQWFDNIHQGVCLALLQQLPEKCENAAYVCLWTNPSGYAIFVWIYFLHQISFRPIQQYNVGQMAIS